jgi:hypothetical protein
LPHVASLVSVLAALQLLDFFRPVYLTMSHRFWESTVFKVDYPLFSSLLVLTLVVAIWILSHKPWAVLLPLIEGVTLLIFDPPTRALVLSSSSFKNLEMA